MSMKIEARFTLINCNVRREKAGKDGIGSIASDLKFNGEIGHKAAKNLFSTKAAYEALLGNLFDKKGALVTNDCKSTNLSHEAEHVVADLVAAGKERIHLENGRLKGIVLQPKEGGIVEINFTLSVYATKEQRGDLEELIQYQVDVKASGRQVEMHLEEEESEDEQEELEVE